MKPVLLLLLCFGPIALGADFRVLSREHVDGPKVLFSEPENALQVVLRDYSTASNYTGTNVILLVNTESRLILPAGTPFGAAGAPLWVLPQSQNPNVLYLGISAENIPIAAFSGPLDIRVTAFDGPGYFMVWQATGPGQFNVRIDTRNGLDSTDALTPAPGAHEHFNWGFSTTGVYCVTYQVSGTRSTGQVIFSPEITVAFHVLPLPPPTNFPTWQKHHWPPGFHPELTGKMGDPDGDTFSNLHEYAFGLSPTQANPSTFAPAFHTAYTNNALFGAFSMLRYTMAADLRIEALAAADVTGPWLPLTNVVSIIPGTNLAERVTWLDNSPISNTAERFYRPGVILLE